MTNLWVKSEGARCLCMTVCSCTNPTFYLLVCGHRSGMVHMHSTEKERNSVCDRRIRVNMCAQAHTLP